MSDVTQASGQGSDEQVGRRIFGGSTLGKLVSPFTKSELSFVLGNPKTGKAPGIDGVCAEMLTRLGPRG